MDWLWGSSSKDPKKDPTKQLEPGLREYLDKESPGKYAPAPSALPAPQPPSDQQPAPTAPGQDADKPTVPPQTSFPDGRYAHLWKTYRPPQDSDIGIKEELSAAEKVIETAKYRKSLTFRAALENCAEEQFAFQNCLINGDLSNRIKAAVTMCQLQNRAFNRCFMVQGQLLRSLGYVRSSLWDPEREERIQMHADSLYHQMLDYEAKVEEARAAKREPPPLKSLFDPNYKPGSSKTKTPGGHEVEIPGFEALPKGFKFSKKAQDLTPHERELELRVFKSEQEEAMRYLEEVTPWLAEMEEGRQKRRKVLGKWLGPGVADWIIPPESKENK